MLLTPHIPLKMIKWMVDTNVLFFRPITSLKLGMNHQGTRKTLSNSNQPKNSDIFNKRNHSTSGFQIIFNEYNLHPDNQTPFQWWIKWCNYRWKRSTKRLLPPKVVNKTNGLSPTPTFQTYSYKSIFNDLIKTLDFNKKFCTIFFPMQHVNTKMFNKGI